MKSRIARPTPTILTYGIAEDSEKFSKIHALCKELKVILPEDTSQQLGYLFGFNGFSRNDDAPQEIPLLKANNIKTDLKAVVTAHNQKWTFEKLITELLKEKSSLKSE